MSAPWFNRRKAAQMVAYFAQKQDPAISVLKVVKLVYLADRLSLEKFGFPILDDELVSMPHGPVNSWTYNQINGMDEDSDEWSQFVGKRDGNFVPPARAFSDDDFDEFSEADLEVLAETWGTFGGKDPFELVKWTHDNCPEWEDPKGSSNPIPLSRLFKYLNLDDAEGLESEILSERKVDEIFANAVV